MTSRSALEYLISMDPNNRGVFSEIYKRVGLNELIRACSVIAGNISYVKRSEVGNFSQT